MILSILLPALAHTAYDALLFYAKYNVLSILLFFMFDTAMVVICLLTVNRTSKIQQNLDNNLNTGMITTDDAGQLVFTPLIILMEIPIIALYVVIMLTGVIIVRNVALK